MYLNKKLQYITELLLAIHSPFGEKGEKQDKAFIRTCKAETLEFKNRQCKYIQC